MNTKRLEVHNSAFQLPDEMFLVVPHTHASGGVQRERRITDESKVGQNGERVESINVQIVSDVEERERAEKLANVAKALVVKHLQYTPLGYLANPQSLARLDLGLVDLATAIAQHNRNARYSFCTVSILRVRIARADLGANEVRSIADKLRSELEALAAAVRSGDAYEYRKCVGRAPNLPSLCVGAVKMSVEAGIKEAADAVEALRQNAKDRERAAGKGLPVPALLDPVSIPLGNLETAIQLITE